MHPNLTTLAGLIASGRASVEDMERVDLDFVLGVKSNAKLPQYRMVARETLTRKDDDSRVVSFIASDETVDRMGDIIRVKGWDLKNYRRNPVILWGHADDAPPIGTGKARKGEVSGGKPALLMDVTFADESLSPFAEQVYQLVKAKVIRGNSVGFIPIKTSRPEAPEERDEIGLGPFGLVFEKQELIEDSIVSVPANPSAVALAFKDMVKRSLLSQEQADVFLHDAMGYEPGDYMDRARRAVIDLSGIREALAEIADAGAEESGEVEDPVPVGGDTTGSERYACPSDDCDGIDAALDEMGGEMRLRCPDCEDVWTPEEYDVDDLEKTAPATERVRGIPLASYTLVQTASLGPPSCGGDAGATHNYAVWPSITDGTTGGTPWVIDYPPSTGYTYQLSNGADPALVAAITRLIEMQTEQMAVTRQLTDVLADLARKVLDLGAGTATTPAEPEEPGDEEVDSDTLRSLSESLAALAQRVDRASRG